MSSHIEVGVVILAEVPETLWRHLEVLLSEQERARAARLRFEDNRREHIAAHALKRLMLCEAAGGTPRDWVFATDAGGKPRVADRLGPCFNLSHCEGLVACALSIDLPLGVDVESFRRPAPLDVADHHLAPGERAWLYGLPATERSRGFFKLWTMKEAVMKATGTGLSQSPQTFMVGFDPLRIVLPDPDWVESGEWRLTQETLGQDHVLGLAWRGPPAAVTLRAVHLEEIVGG